MTGSRFFPTEEQINLIGLLDLGVEEKIGSKPKILSSHTDGGYNISSSKPQSASVRDQAQPVSSSLRMAEVKEIKESMQDTCFDETSVFEDTLAAEDDRVLIYPLLLSDNEIENFKNDIRRIHCEEKVSIPEDKFLEMNLKSISYIVKFTNAANETAKNTVVMDKKLYQSFADQIERYVEGHYATLGSNIGECVRIKNALSHVEIYKRVFNYVSDSADWWQEKCLPVSQQGLTLEAMQMLDADNSEITSVVEGSPLGLFKLNSNYSASSLYSPDSQDDILTELPEAKSNTIQLNLPSKVGSSDVVAQNSVKKERCNPCRLIKESASAYLGTLFAKFAGQYILQQQKCISVVENSAYKKMN